MSWSTGRWPVGCITAGREGRGGTGAVPDPGEAEQRYPANRRPEGTPPVHPEEPQNVRGASVALHHPGGGASRPGRTVLWFGGQRRQILAGRTAGFFWPGRCLPHHEAGLRHDVRTESAGGKRPESDR